ncbi:hypothetical protein Q7P37_007693 [Cladosporium fusiforme]
MENTKQPRPDNVDFNFSDMNWEAYTAFRPAYPDALFEKIYDYQQLHGGATQSALDVGAGIGIVAVKLLEQFDNVILSDPSDLYISQAREFFQFRSLSGISFLHSGAANLSLDILPKAQPVDLITAGTCLHWTDLDVCMPRFASLLKPNGTFAAFAYGGRPLVGNTPESSEIQKLLGDISDRFSRDYIGKFGKQDEKSAAAVLNARYDSLPLDYALWKDVRRIHANKNATMVSDWWPLAPSQVGPDDAVEELDDAFLSRDVDYDWLEGYFRNLIPVIDVSKVAGDQLAQLKDTMAGGTVQIRWNVVLILATKR